MLSRREMLSGTALATVAAASGLTGGVLHAAVDAGPGFDIAAANADYATGLQMWPFRAQVSNGTRVLKDLGQDPDYPTRDSITWWRVDGRSITVDGHELKFLPLGDTVSVKDGGPQSTAALLLAPDPAAPDALAHPIAFRWTEDDADGHGDAHFAYMDLVPPPGYAALGQAFVVKSVFGETNGQQIGQNDLASYWCVKLEHVRKIARLNGVWSDHGTGWQHNGDLRTPGFGENDLTPSDAVFVLPLTMIGAESPMVPLALRMQRAVLREIQDRHRRRAGVRPKDAIGRDLFTGSRADRRDAVHRVHRYGDR